MTRLYRLNIFQRITRAAGGVSNREIIQYAYKKVFKKLHGVITGNEAPQYNEQGLVLQSHGWCQAETNCPPNEDPSCRLQTRRI
jgi:hypothetical protein